MIRRRKFARKPKILELQKEVATLIRAQCKQVEFNQHPTGRYYWTGVYKFEGNQIRVHWQNYSSRPGVDYVDISYRMRGRESVYDRVYKKELLRIKEVLTANNFYE